MSMMTNSLFVRVSAPQRADAAGRDHRRAGHGPGRPNKDRNLVALFVECLREARVMARQANRRFPFGCD